MNKDYIQTEREFLDALVYWPISTRDQNWDDFKWEVQKSGGIQENMQSVRDVANFLNSHSDFWQDKTPVQSIRYFYKDTSLKLETFNSVEACPSEDGRNYYLRDGNRRSIAIAMRLLKREIKFVPLKIIDWEDHFMRENSKDLGRPPNNL